MRMRWGRSADLLTRAFFWESSCLLYNRTKRQLSQTVIVILLYLLEDKEIMVPF